MQIELLEIDFNSEEAIYMQLRNQIILGIATSRLQDGDTLPSVRQMAECIGISFWPRGDVITFPGRKHIGCWMKSMICGSNPPKTR